jgi:hypothetical protein
MRSRLSSFFSALVSSRRYRFGDAEKLHNGVLATVVAPFYRLHMLVHGFDTRGGGIQGKPAELRRDQNRLAGFSSSAIDGEE